MQARTRNRICEQVTPLGHEAVEQVRYSVLPEKGALPVRPGASGWTEGYCSVDPIAGERLADRQHFANRCNRREHCIRRRQCSKAPSKSALQEITGIGIPCSGRHRISHRAQIAAPELPGVAVLRKLGKCDSQLSERSPRLSGSPDIELWRHAAAKNPRGLRATKSSASRNMITSPVLCPKPICGCSIDWIWV